MAHEPTSTEQQQAVAQAEPSEVIAPPPVEAHEKQVEQSHESSASAPVVVPAEPVAHPTPVAEPVQAVEPTQAQPESVQQPHVQAQHEPVPAQTQQHDIPQPVQAEQVVQTPVLAQHVEPHPVQPVVESQPIVESQPVQPVQAQPEVQPVVESQPVVAQPVVVVPPEVAQPVAQPVVAQPEVQPVVAQPVVAPVVAQPVVAPVVAQAVQQPVESQPIQQVPVAQPVIASTSSSSASPYSRLYLTPDAERPIDLAASGFGTKQPTTVIEVFKATATKYTEDIAMSVKRDATWKHWNWGQFYNDAIQFARALIHMKFQPTQTVSILGFNSPEWFIADIGAIAAGGLAAGIYTTNGPDACAYIVGHSKSTVVVVENESQLKKILAVKEKLPSVQAIVQWSGVVPTDAPGLIYSWEAFLALGENVPVAEVDARIADLKPGRACTLIYTSGTTGPPKAVMLSHDNLTYTAAAASTVAKLDHNEVIVSYLPLSHIAAQIVDIHGNIFVGGHVWFAQPDALKGSLGDTLKEVRPTIFFGVPRVWEKIQEKMVQVGKNNGTIKRKIATWAKGVGIKGGKARQQRHSMPFGWTVAQKLVFDKVRVALGLDRARYLATAAAPMPEDTAEFFLSLNVPICDVYGMSEVSGPSTMTPTESFRPGSIGVPVPGIDVKILNPDAEGNGEICWKGRSSFLGYMYNEKETAETFDSQGWLHTGDVGRQDKDGYLYITGRIKELIITAGGENVAPTLIEDDMKIHLGGLVSNVMVVGDKRKFLACLITLKTDPIPEPAEGQYSFTDNLSKDALTAAQGAGSSAKTVQEAKTDAALKKWIFDAIGRYNKTAHSNAQQVRAFIILDQDFTVDNELLTPTMKLKRRVVATRYGKEIDEMYVAAEKEFEGGAK